MQKKDVKINGVYVVKVGRNLTHVRITQTNSHSGWDGITTTGKNVRIKYTKRFSPSNLFDGASETYWATDDGVTSAEIVLDFSKPIAFNVVSLREYLPLGQRVNVFAIDVYSNDSWREYHRAAARGNRRIIAGQNCTARKVRLRIIDSSACPAISELALHCDPQK